MYGYALVYVEYMKSSLDDKYMYYCILRCRDKKVQSLRSISLSCISSMLDSYLIAPFKSCTNSLSVSIKFFGSASSKELFECFLSDSIPLAQPASRSDFLFLQQLQVIYTKLSFISFFCCQLLIASFDFCCTSGKCVSQFNQFFLLICSRRVIYISIICIKIHLLYKPLLHGILQCVHMCQNFPNELNLS